MDLWKGLAVRISVLGTSGVAAALALGALALLMPERSEAAAFCQAIASTATKAENSITNNPGGFNCHADASTLHVVQFPGSGNVTTDVGPGVLRTSTRAESSDSVGEGTFVLTQAVVDFRDSFTVDGLSPDGALLNFQVGIGGLMDATGSVGVTAGSSFRFTGALGNRSRAGGTNRVFQACIDNLPGECNSAFDVSADFNAVVQAFVSLSVFAYNGDVIDLILAQNSSSLTIIPVPNGGASTGALFLHTTDWLGLDVTDANRNVTLTSLSGFDYRYAALAPPGVPEPTTWALTILGFGAAGAALRRRRAVSA
jgi:hypothetical protein